MGSESGDDTVIPLKSGLQSPLMRLRCFSTLYAVGIASELQLGYVSVGLYMTYTWSSGNILLFNKVFVMTNMFFKLKIRVFPLKDRG